MKQLIIAGNYRQYVNYIEKYKLSRNDTVYISREEILLGRAQEELENIKFIGTWWERSDIDIIQMRLSDIDIIQMRLKVITTH